MVSHIEQMLRAVPEVESTSRRTGLQLGLAAVTEANTGDIAVKLKDKRSRGVDDIMAELREQIRTAGAGSRCRVHPGAARHDRRSDERAAADPDQAVLADAALLAQWAPRVGDAISKVAGVVDVLNGIENTISGPATVFQVNPEMAARAGFTPEEIAIDASAILEGEPAATPVITNDIAYTIRVRFPDENRSSLEAMSNTLLNSATGHTATLGTVCQRDGVAGTDGDSPREPATRCGGHGAAGRPRPRHRRRGGAEGRRRPASARLDSRRVRRHLRRAAAIVSRSDDGAAAGNPAGVRGAALRVSNSGGAAGDSLVGAAVHVRRFSGAAHHAHDFQHCVVHGIDHGDRHRGQEWHSAAGRRSAVFARWGRRRTMR